MIHLHRQGWKNTQFFFGSCSVLVLGVQNIFRSRSVLVRDNQHNFCSRSVLDLEQEHVLEQLACSFIPNMDSLSFSRIYYLFRDSTMNSLSFSGTHYSFSKYFMNSLSSSRIYYPFCKFIINPLFFSPNHHEFTIFPANLLSIYYQFRGLTLKLISISRIHCLKLIICFAITL